MSRNTSSDSTRITRGDAWEVTDGRVEVTACKIFTSKGERLELREPGGQYIRLDAIELESLSWQDPSVFAELIRDTQDVTGEPTAEPDGIETDRPLRVSNEYSEVRLHRAGTTAGEALQIASEPLHYENVVSPASLRAIIEQDHGLFSQFLNQPYGPIDD